ncbi:MFS transporter [Amycolatopsis sp.]|uniref:MFS transporter n=1 Tax=Amycolatopsis sp. TaxID=37632 RepID=UPI002B69CB05|nr:MFS transporter [Amycolatopsis sp.]HVV09280.1 MFS transporter [Amycolatopsis sp.]
MTSPASAEARSRRARATRAGAIGNFIEFYDFTLYGFFAITISQQFFPAFSSQAALLATFAVYGGSFVMRPVGAIVFGHVADRWGRKRALLIAVVLMSVSTAAIGVLPGYAAIGVAAPLLLLLCRLAQAFSAGGEQSGSYVLVIEHSPVDRRGRNGSWLVLSVMAGVMGGALLSLLMSAVTTKGQMDSWGWRVPFLIGIPLGLLGLYLRMKLRESATFQAAAVEVARTGRRHIPLVQAFRTVRREMLTLFAWIGIVSLAGYLLIGFMVTLMVKFEGYTMSAALLVIALAFLIAMPVVHYLCRLSDRLSRKMFAGGLTLGLAVWTVPAFLLIGQGPVAATIAIAVYIVFVYPMNLAAGFAVVELFPVDVRASASALPYQLGFALFGGTASLVATWLVSTFNSVAPAYYVAVVALCEVFVAWKLLPNAREMAVVTGAGDEIKELPGHGSPQWKVESSAQVREDS